MLTWNELVTRKVRNVIDEFNKAKENGELVFTDTESTMDETCGEALRPLTRDEILQRCKDAIDVYVVSIQTFMCHGWCYLQFAIPENEGDPLSVFMYPLKNKNIGPFLYDPEKFEVYDVNPYEFENLKEPDIIKP